jgi:hypothetical protein
VLAPSTIVWSMPSLNIAASKGLPFMNDCPTMTWSQPVIVPSGPTAPRM